MRRFEHYSFPLKLKMLRLEAGKSQEELAAELGISRSALANYETGKRQPDADMLLKMADVFHVLSDFLIGRPGYQHLALCESEIKAGKRMKETLKKHQDTLDLSSLALEHKIALIEYYDYILSQQASDSKTEMK